MIRLPFTAVQAGLYARLHADIPALGIFTMPDTVNPVFPFMILSGFSASDAGQATPMAWTVTADLDIYSQQGGNSEINTLCGSVLGSLSRGAMDLSSYQFQHNETFLDSVSTSVESGDERGPIQHGSIRVRITVTDTGNGSWS